VTGIAAHSKTESWLTLTGQTAHLGADYSFRYRLPDGWLNQHIFKVTANSELVTKDFLYYWYSTFLEKWSQKMLIFGVKSSFLELGILAVQKRELIIEEVHILIQMPIFLGLLKLFVDKCRNEWYIPI